MKLTSLWSLIVGNCEQRVLRFNWRSSMEMMRAAISDTILGVRGTEKSGEFHITDQKLINWTKSIAVMFKLIFNILDKANNKEELEEMRTWSMCSSNGFQLQSSNTSGSEFYSWCGGRRYRWFMWDGFTNLYSCDWFIFSNKSDIFYIKINILSWMRLENLSYHASFSRFISKKFINKIIL